MPTFYHFSSAYTAVALYVIMVPICSKENLGVFLRLGSLGALFITMFIVFIVGLSIYENIDTEYKIGTVSDAQ